MPRYQALQRGGAPQFDLTTLLAYGLEPICVDLPWCELGANHMRRLSVAVPSGTCAATDLEDAWAGEEDTQLEIGSVIAEAPLDAASPYLILAGVRDLDGALALRAGGRAGVRELRVTLLRAAVGDPMYKLAMGVALKRTLSKGGRPKDEKALLVREGYHSLERLVAEYDLSYRTATTLAASMLGEDGWDHTGHVRAHKEHRYGLSCPEHGAVRSPRGEPEPRMGICSACQRVIRGRYSNARSTCDECVRRPGVAQF